VIEDLRTFGGLVRVVSPIAMGRGNIRMSQITNGILAAVAVSATLGAAQFASGHDLAGLRQFASTTPITGINRAAKADRAAVKAAPGQANTIAFHPGDLAATSVLVRVPVRAKDEAKDQARNRPAVPAKPAARTIACEPPVSVLTEVAKLLQPGRCVT
jgi:hypothetical protein